MEKAMYPSKIIRITQKHGVGTHKRNYAVDEAGADGGIGNIIAPFTGVIKKVYTQDANEVWLESKNKVKYADGTEDYMTILFCHDNSVTSLWVGKEIKQGEVFYQEGTKGQASGNHVHFECGKGKFTGTGWHNDNGSWDINNGKRVDECLWIDDTYTIKDTAGYKFRNTKEVEKKYVGKPVTRNEDVDQVEVFGTTTILNARKTPNGEVLGYINSGIYNLLERKADGDYEWFKVEKDVWFAYSKDWCKVLPKKEEPIEPPKIVEPQPTTDEIQKRIGELEYQVSQLNAVQDILEKENAELKKQLAEQPKLIFTSPKTDYYAIELKEGQKLFLQ